MKNLKLKTFLITLPLLMSSLAACNMPSNNNKSSKDSNAENSEGGDSASQSSSGDKITIKFWHTFGQTVVDGLKSKINDFKKAVKENDGVDVEVDLKYPSCGPEPRSIP